MQQQAAKSAQEGRYSATTRSRHRTLSLSDFSKYLQKYESYVPLLHLSARVLYAKYNLHSDFEMLSQDLRFYIKRLSSYYKKPSNYKRKTLVDHMSLYLKLRLLPVSIDAYKYEEYNQKLCTLGSTFITDEKLVLGQNDFKILNTWALSVRDIVQTPEKALITAVKLLEDSKKYHSHQIGEQKIVAVLFNLWLQNGYGKPDLSSDMHDKMATALQNSFSNLKKCQKLRTKKK